MLKQLATLLVLLLSAVIVQAQVYKWTDEHGKTHYTSQPPSDQKIKSSTLTTQNNAISEEALCQRACSNAEKAFNDLEHELTRRYNQATDYQTKKAVLNALNDFKRGKSELMSSNSTYKIGIKQGCLAECPAEYKKDPNHVNCLASAYTVVSFDSCMKNKK